MYNQPSYFTKNKLGNLMERLVPCISEDNSLISILHGQICFIIDSEDHFVLKYQSVKELLRAHVCHIDLYTFVYIYVYADLK